MKKGRQKGTTAKKRVRDIQTIRNEVRAYEDALDRGETSEEYKIRTAIRKSKIFGWRQCIKKAEAQEK